jgi:hypothetical protein
MKKKLLIILGAGSSMGCGMPSVGELDAHMERWSDDWSYQHGFSNHYRALKAAITRYYSGGPRSKPIPNFEKTLGDMIAFSHWVTPAPYGDTLRQAACGGTMPPNFTFKSAELSDPPAPYAGTVEVMDQRTYLLIELARFFRSLCVKIDVSSESHRKYRALAQGLTDAFDVGVYNLNYDTLALLAWPKAFTGFNDRGEFDAATLHQRREWGFVYHLRGGVHQSLDRPFGGERIVWRSDLDNSASFFDGPEGHPADVRSEGKTIPRTTLVAGGFKLDQLLVEPFHSLHAALVRHVYEADSVLIGGYGFGDEHVNRALSNRLGRRVASDRVPIMVLDRAGCRTDPMCFRSDDWSHNLIRTLDAPRDFFREPGHTAAPVPHDLASRGGFEVSEQHRVAIWHGGFVEAASRVDRVVEWLLGADDFGLSGIVSGDRRC